MATFSRTPQSQPLDRSARMQTMMATPFGGPGLMGEVTNAIEQAKQGAIDSYGFGTVIRDLATPSGNTRPTPNFAQQVAAGNPLTAGIVAGYGAARDAINALRPQQPSMSEDEYKASPFFREGIGFEPGMTEDRASSLAAFYDTKKVREYFGQKRPVSTFVGQFAGQAIDPINYVPVFGVAAETAAVARLGTIAGRLVLGASDAAINTAAFGVLTSGAREKFGDDVSWGAVVNEIGMSALIGGAFGTGAGLLAVRRNFNFAREDARRFSSPSYARAQNELANFRNLKEGVAVLNDAVGSLMTTGDVNLSPNSAAVIDRIQGEVSSRSAADRALGAETARVEGTKPGEVAITPSGQRVNVKPEVVDASTLVRATGDLQVRNRSSAASAAQVEDIAINLDPARLMPSIDADSGAPIVGDDNIIDSGNGRVMAIARAYEAYPARAAAYRKSLQDAGYDLTGIANPILISRRTTPLSREARAQFNAEANSPRAAQMSAVELAAMDRGALDDAALNALDVGPVTAPGNRAMVGRFLSNIPQSARGALVDAAGNLNADGVRRIENALVAAAYGDVDANVLRRFAEATDDNTRAIVGAMSDVAGKWALMRRAVKAGDISPEFDVTEELTQALRLIGQWREQAAREKRPVSMVIKEGMAQIDMLSGEISPEAQVMIGAFYKTNSFAQAAGRDTIAEFLGRVADAAAELGRPQLFETADVGKLELLRNVAVNEQGNLFTPIGAVDGIEADGGFTRGTEAPADRQDNRPAVEGDGRGSITDRMTERFVAAGRPADEAAATAQLVDSFYTQQAARLGISPAELEERFGLPDVQRGGDVGADALAQSPQSPAFKEWFGDSKVVDANGEPLVVYHGTDSPDFDAFKPGSYFTSDRTEASAYTFNSDVRRREKAADKYVVGSGKEFVGKTLPYAGTTSDFEGPEIGDVFATDQGITRYLGKGRWEVFSDVEPDGDTFNAAEMTISVKGGEFDAQGIVDDYAASVRAAYPGGDGGRVYPVYLSIKNPVVLGPFEGNRLGRRLGADDESIRAEIEKYKAQGYDGIETVSDEAHVFEGRAIKQFIPFDASQIKSQFNRGTFDPNDPRLLFQPAYHGSPHVFDKFSLDKVGTGEGNQAFGHGLYFAGRKEVAKHYREALSTKAADIVGNYVTFTIRRGRPMGEGATTKGYLESQGFDASPEIVGLIDRAIAGGTEGRAGSIDYSDDAVQAFSKLDTALNKPGRLYHVDIPDDAEMLDWSKKLTEQSASVKAALKESGLLKEFKENLSDYASPQNTRGVGRGENLYEYLSWKLGSPEAASARLREIGVPGHRYPAGTIAGVEGGGHNYVVYDDSRVSVRSFEQGGANPRGAIQLGDTNIISLFETADASTALHETGHLFLGMFKGMADAPDAPISMKADWEAVKGWWGENADAVAADAVSSGRAADVTGKDVLAVLSDGTSGDKAKDMAIDVGFQEQWARAFESYLRDGKAPSSGLARAFDQFRQWLTDVYRRATDLNVNVSDDIKRVFDNLLAPAKDATKAADEPSLDLGEPKPRAMAATLMPNDTVEQATSRVGKPEDIRQIALAHGVDPTTGSFVEQGDIDQIRAEGRLHADDEAVLRQADETFDAAEAYGKALDAAARCIL